MVEWRKYFMGLLRGEEKKKRKTGREKRPERGRNRGRNNQRVRSNEK